jgi:hypothetical protein
MDNTKQNIFFLAEAFAEATNRAVSTISRLATGSGQTVANLKLVDDAGQPKHRITTDRAFRALSWFSDNWPDDLEWPEGIERPTNKNEAA